MSPKDLIAWASSVRGFGPEDFERLRELGQALEHSEALREAAEKVCELGLDAQHSIEHYEWCDRVKAMKIRREIPPGECDCGVLAFKVAIANWFKLREGGKG